ncbi:MAG: ABC transporter permease [Erysipelotrichaceae bacterium]|nr:ABC transporter permease [Erysipelotrichaceae bacterium]
MGQILSALFDVFKNVQFYNNVIAVTPPILLAALGCSIAAKANMVNMGMEGIMLLSSFIGTLAAAYIGGPNPWLGLLVAIVVGGVLGYLVAFFNLKMKVDIILVGIAMNLFGTGATAFFLPLVTPNADRSSTNSLQSGMLPNVNIPGIKNIPVLGEILQNQNILTYISYLLIIVMAFLMFKTKLGLRIRAVGENDHAAESVGISSDKIKTIALIISGCLGGIGGAFMSSVYVSYFANGIVAGRGFIGLAACSMGEANPIPTALTSILFGFFYALSNFARATGISDNLMKMWPYLATLIGVVLYSINKQRKEKKRLAGLASLEEDTK